MIAALFASIALGAAPVEQAIELATPTGVIHGTVTMPAAKFRRS